MIKADVYGMYHGIRAFVTRMLADEDQTGMVTMSSIGGLAVGPSQGAYITSKFAVQALTECLYMELRAGRANIAVSGVAPGRVSTLIFETRWPWRGMGQTRFGPPCALCCGTRA
jgi:NAD(P)-dependent dehydrogenase (short-subunit alcohol dehydrogenase family)